MGQVGLQCANVAVAVIARPATARERRFRGTIPLCRHPIKLPCVSIRPSCRRPNGWGRRNLQPPSSRYRIGITTRRAARMINCFTWVAPSGVAYGLVVEAERTLNDWSWEATICLNGLPCHRLVGTTAREEDIRADVEAKLVAAEEDLTLRPSI